MNILKNMISITEINIFQVCFNSIGSFKVPDAYVEFSINIFDLKISLKKLFLMVDVSIFLKIIFKTRKIEHCDFCFEL